VKIDSIERRLALAAFLLLGLAVSGRAQVENSSPPVDGAAVIESMVQQRIEAARAFRGYKVIRTFRAENFRFNKLAKMVVETDVTEGPKSESKVISTEGSGLIQKRVFEKILEAEGEANRDRKDIDIIPDNYRFHFEELAEWNGRANFVFAITPIRKSKYAIDGRIWLDRDDLHIARIVGSPSKNPSFWTTRVLIDKEYRKRDGQWVPAKLVSESWLRVVGRSKLEIAYAYPDKSGTITAIP
jgi:hypothetical protein